MLCSIIMPCYNSERYIAYAISSVQNQTLSEWELLVIDDGSSDGSVDLVNDLAKRDSRITLIRSPGNMGAAAARNKAIEAAQGRFIAFLDSDDLWRPEKLAKQISFMLNHGYALTYTDYCRVDENCSLLSYTSSPASIDYRSLLKTNVIGCLTAVYDSKQLGKIYMPTGTKREDFATWLSILKVIPCAYCLQECLADYRVYSSQSSAKKMNMAIETWNVYRKEEDLSFFRTLYYFSHYSFKGIIRSKLPIIGKILGLV